MNNKLHDSASEAKSLFSDLSHNKTSLSSHKDSVLTEQGFVLPESATIFFAAGLAPVLLNKKGEL